MLNDKKPPLSKFRKWRLGVSNVGISNVDISNVDLWYFYR